MPRRLSFSDKEKKKITEDYKSGLSLRQVASKNKVSKSAVQRIIEDAGIMRALNGVDPKPPTKKSRPGTIMSRGVELRKLYDADPHVTVYTLAEQYNCSISAIHRSLVAAGTEMRQAGGDKRSPSTRGLLGWVRS
jgi:hypothetical protein